MILHSLGCSGAKLKGVEETAGVEVDSVNSMGQKSSAAAEMRELCRVRMKSEKWQHLDRLNPDLTRNTSEEIPKSWENPYNLRFADRNWIERKVHVKGRATRETGADYQILKNFQRSSEGQTDISSCHWTTQAVLAIYRGISSLPRGETRQQSVQWWVRDESEKTSGGIYAFTGAQPLICMQKKPMQIWTWMQTESWRGPTCREWKESVQKRGLSKAVRKPELQVESICEKSHAASDCWLTLMSEAQQPSHTAFFLSFPPHCPPPLYPSLCAQSLGSPLHSHKRVHWPMPIKSFLCISVR